MPGLPTLNDRDLVRVFNQDGWEVIRQTWQSHNPRETRAHSDPLGAGSQGSG
jgi:hypothetical protein